MIADLEHERWVIGAVLKDWLKMAPHVVGVLRPDDFALPPHQHIMQAVENLSTQQGAAVDVVTVGTELQRLGVLTKIGPMTPTDLADLMQFVDSTGAIRGVEPRVRRVAQLGQLRKTQALAMDLASSLLGAQAQADPDSAIADAQRRLAEVTGVSRTLRSRPLHEGLQDALNEWRSLEEQGRSPGLRTGVSVLDGYVKPKPGQLIVVGARPSLGKSSLMLQMAEAGAPDGPVVYFSLEMELRELALRLVAEAVGVPASELMDTVPSAQVRAEVMRQVQRVSGLPVHVVTQRLTIEQIRTHAIAEALRHDGLAAVYVDHLHIVRDSPGMQGDSKSDRIGHKSAAAKEIAKELGCPVIVGAQLNRGVESSDRAPGLADLRSSGDIEQDADVVMFIHGNPNQDVDGRNRERQFLVRKNRNGRCGDVDVWFVPEATRFIGRAL